MPRPIAKAQVILCVSNPEVRYREMSRALDILYRAEPRAYTALACLISCYIDALVGGKKAAYLKFLESNFRQLCAALNHAHGKLKGSEVFYKFYRSNMVHNFFPRSSRFALAENYELRGKYVAECEAESHTVLALNMDRLYRDVRALLRRRAARGSA